MRIIILFNHLQIQDGVTRAAIGMANALARKPGVEVTLCPLFRYDPSMLNMIDKRVLVKPVFKKYFRGFSKLVCMLPMSYLHKRLIGNEYDVEVGFCRKLPIQIVAAYPEHKDADSYRNSIMHMAWMHNYDTGLALRAEYKRMDKVVCVSKFIANRLKKEAKGEFVIDYCYNLLNGREIRDKGKQRVNMRKPDGALFVSVGRMSPEKGYMRLLEITGRLINEGYYFHLWLIGDGVQKNALMKKAKVLGLDNIVAFLGEQNNPHAYVAKADLFVCSSFVEGYSTACVEASLLGIPVLTTNVSGAKEILHEAEAGLLVGMDNKDLYMGMRKILDNPEILGKWKDTLTRTKERFSFESRVDKLYEIFDISHL